MMSFSVWSHVPAKEGLCPERGSLSREGVPVQRGGLCPERGSLSREGVFVQGDFLSRGILCPEGVSDRGSPSRGQILLHGQTDTSDNITFPCGR